MHSMIIVTVVSMKGVTVSMESARSVAWMKADVPRAFKSVVITSGDHAKVKSSLRMKTAMVSMMIAMVLSMKSQIKIALLHVDRAASRAKEDNGPHVARLQSV